MINSKMKKKYVFRFPLIYMDPNQAIFHTQETFSQSPKYRKINIKRLKTFRNEEPNILIFLF